MANTLKCINTVILNALGQPLQGVTVEVLTGTINGASAVVTTTQPGTPAATCYADPQGSNAVTQPLTTDGLGNLISTYLGVSNLGVWVASGYYVLQVYGTGIVGQLLIPLSV